LAVRVGPIIQVVDLEVGDVIKECVAEEDVAITYWTWLTDDLLAFVTDTAVFHWGMQRASECCFPHNVCRCHVGLPFAQLTGTRTECSLERQQVTTAVCCSTPPRLTCSGVFSPCRACCSCTTRRVTRHDVFPLLLAALRRCYGQCRPSCAFWKQIRSVRLAFSRVQPTI
jgi:hypothetical protein